MTLRSSDQAQCQVPDLSSLTPAHRVTVPEIYMTSGKFPDVRQGDQFCTRCTGRLVTKKEGNYKFFLASDDGSLMYLNGEKIVDNNGCHGEQERGSGDKFLKPGAHEIVVDMCERGGGEVFKMRWKGPDSGNSKVKIPAAVLKHEKPKFNLADGMKCEYFYDQSQCHIPDLGALKAAHSVIVPEIYMTHGKFPDVRQGDRFCTRCTGRLVTKKEGNYKFFLASDDGSFMYLNGEKIVDNNGCHGETEKGSGDKFLKPGAHEIMVDMCEMGGGEVLKMRWKGPDSGNSKVKIPAAVLKHDKDVPVDQYGTIDVQGKTYNKFWWFTKGSSWPAGKADVLGDSFGTCDDGDKVCFQRLPKVEEKDLELLAVDDVGNQFRWKFDASNSVAHAAFEAFRHGKTTQKTQGPAWAPEVLKGSVTSGAQDTLMYRDQDGIRSFMLDDDACDCHSTLSMGHAMCGSGCNQQYGNCQIKGGVDKLSDRAETGGEGSGSSCTGPATDHGLTLYFRQKGAEDEEQADEAWLMGGNGDTCDKVCSSNGFEGCDKTKMVALTSNEKVGAAFKEAGYTCRGFHGARNYAGTPFSTSRNDDCAPVTAGTSASALSCDKNNHGHHKPLCACKGRKDVDLEDGLECDYFYDQSQCQVPDLGTLTPAHRVTVPEIYMTHGKFPDVRQGDQFCTRCTGRLVTKKEGSYKFFLASDDGSLMYLNGEKVVDNNGCHGEQERGSGDKFLKPGAHDIVVDMCERGGGEVLKMRWKGPDSGNSKVKIPATALKHEKAMVKGGLVCDYYYDQSQCQVPDLGTLTPGNRVVVPELHMTNGNFPEVKQGNQFCVRCTGQLVTKKEGNYKFFTVSDDGSLMYLNGEKIVDNNGCHGSRERGSNDKFLKPGTHDIMVDMCERGGGEVFKMRWKGPDSDNSKVKIPARALQHVEISLKPPLVLSHKATFECGKCQLSSEGSSAALPTGGPFTFFAEVKPKGQAGKHPGILGWGSSGDNFVALRMFPGHNNGGLHLYWKANGQFKEVAVESAGLLNDGWKTVAASWDKSTIKLYANGQLLKSSGYSGAFNAADKSGFCACVGEPGRTHEAFGGKLRNVQIMNKALSDAEIAKPPLEPPMQLGAAPLRAIAT